jgi:hypothetical protein
MKVINDLKDLGYVYKSYSYYHSKQFKHTPALLKIDALYSKVKDLIKRKDVNVISVVDEELIYAYAIIQHISSTACMLHHYHIKKLYIDYNVDEALKSYLQSYKTVFIPCYDRPLMEMLCDLGLEVIVNEVGFYE